MNKGSCWHLWVPMVVVGLAIAKSSNTCFRTVDHHLLSYIPRKVIFSVRNRHVHSRISTLSRVSCSTLHACKVVRGMPSSAASQSHSGRLPALSPAPASFVTSVGVLALKVRSM